MSSRLTARCLVGLLTLIVVFPALSVAAINPDIVVRLEEPGEATTYSGISNLRGWAVAPIGVNRTELFVDGEFAAEVPYGGSRGDVGSAFPDFPDSSQSGFSMAYNYSNLSEGVHTILIRAFDENDDFNDASATFTVTRYQDPFVRDPSNVSLGPSVVTDNGDKTIFIEDMLVSGELYDVQLEWRTATQGFAITSITPVGGSEPSPTVPDVSGIYRVSLLFVREDCGFLSPGDLPAFGNDTLRLTQDGNSLSGSFGDDLTVTGTVQPNTDFLLHSESERLAFPDCSVDITLRANGNFFNEEMTVLLEVDASSGCPPELGSCAAEYTATRFERVSTLTAQRALRSNLEPGLYSAMINALGKSLFR